MPTRFGLTALILILAAGCEEEAKASSSTGGDSTYDDSDVLARLDALEASVAALQATADANTEAIASIDIDVLSYRVDEMEAELDGLDLGEITAQIESNTDAIAALNTAEYLTAADLPDLSGYLTAADLPDLSGYLTAADLPDLSGFLTADDLPDLSGYLTADDLPAETDLSEVETRLDAVERLATTNESYVAINADRIVEHTTSIDDNQSSISELTPRVENNQTEIVELRGDLDGIDLSVYLTAADLPDLSTMEGNIIANAVNIAGNSTDIDALYDDMGDIESIIDGLYDDMGDIESIPGLADYVSVDDATNTVLFSGANVQVVNGAGSSMIDDNLNGLGNLIIGYNSARFTWSAEEVVSQRTGAHNLVMGPYNAYTNHYGIAHGFWNEAHGRYAVTIAGQYHQATGEGAVTIAGQYNVVEGEDSAAVGGSNNHISGERATSSGGTNNDITGRGAAMIGTDGYTCSMVNSACGGIIKASAYLYH